jgi:hypothetical protein
MTASWIKNVINCEEESISKGAVLVYLKESAYKETQKLGA